MSTSSLRKLALLPACFFMLLTQPFACGAQPAPSGDLASALQAASERDPDLAQWPWRQTAAQAGLQVAQGLTPAPAGVSDNHLSDRLNQNLGRREWELEVDAPMWLPGQHRASIELAQQALNDTQARLSWRRWQLAGELRERWWQLAQARTQADLARQRHQTAQALEADVRRGYQAGGRVQATQTGRIEAPPQGLPELGQRVSKGQVLAYLRPASSSTERGNQQATLAELDAPDTLAERKLQRYAQLEGAIARKDIDTARIERDALQQRRDAVRRTPHRSRGTAGAYQRHHRQQQRHFGRVGGSTRWAVRHRRPEAPHGGGARL